MRSPFGKAHIDHLLADGRLSRSDRRVVETIGHRIERIVEVNGQLFFRLREPRCRVCQSPYRDVIEAAVRRNTFVYGPASSRGIVGRLPSDHQISWRAIRRHIVRRHDPWLTILRQMAIEDRASRRVRSRESLERIQGGLEGAHRKWHVPAQAPLLPRSAAD